MEAGTPDPPFPITSVANAEKWFYWKESISYSPMNPEVLGYFWTFVLGATSEICRRGERENTLLAFIRVLYDKKIGEITSRWNDETNSCEWFDPERISFYHAEVKLGDVFDYYTTDGVLKFPEWVRFKYVVEDYLENDPRVKYHPERVRAFIEERGLERLEEMQ
ncbi:hypothetical protein PF005_g24946 [Phytophthora fragariae]|uniref:Uncharacterized protein n=1 Tax=Phytophthora fragariae TaxID=53985 RepID=A0A6A3WK86_9STRA|nr:hypothetical protein PF003_g34451 [Phytophthora fragariae]KAE8924053.1 hypothetical protein PF009_g25714 [Phytophthora fragariae]KAE8977498.1 hypothetical protein PF011_g23624 [Phytophthora fragariae]KAE9075441.1 hypothetical protein PF010_g24303 [Phytophthora fragariae]KAE9075669.1 hypothetical protein PF007_g24912 [Phytophthora fragariae]